MNGVKLALFSNKIFYTSITLLAILITSYLVYSYNQPIPNPGHGADTILISINGTEKTLQQAINDGNLGGSSATGGGPPSTSFGSFVCYDGSNPCPSDFQKVGVGVYNPSKSRCCSALASSNYEIAVVYIGVDNNGGNSPDCWTISGPGISSCGSQTWGWSGHTNQVCVDALVAYYNTINQGGWGGWNLMDWRDTGDASPCLDGSSDKLEIRLFTRTGFIGP